MSTVHPGNGVIVAPEETPSISKTNLEWLVRLRWMASVGIAVTVALAFATKTVDLWAVPWLFGLTGALAVTNLVWRQQTVSTTDPERLVVIQLATDLAIFAGLLYFSGGIANPMSAAIVFHVLLAVSLVRTSSAYALTGLASVLLAILALLGSANLVPTAFGPPLDAVGVNLCINAVEAMPDGGTLRIGACQFGGTVHVEFEDTGVGVPKEMKERLFCPFESTKEQGTGLGLFLSRRIVTEAGGEIAVRDASPHGTVFALDLPIRIETMTTEAAWATPS